MVLFEALGAAGILVPLACGAWSAWASRRRVGRILGAVACFAFSIGLLLLWGRAALGWTLGGVGFVLLPAASVVGAVASVAGLRRRDGLAITTGLVGLAAFPWLALLLAVAFGAGAQI
jgi:hypothetical protein